MSDEKLRDQERAFLETGSEEAELTWLRERTRAGEKLDWESYSRLHELDVEAAADYLRWRVETGDLSQERLDLGGLFGHPTHGQPPPAHADLRKCALLCASLGVDWAVAHRAGAPASLSILRTLVSELSLGEIRESAIPEQARVLDGVENSADEPPELLTAMIRDALWLQSVSVEATQDSLRDMVLVLECLSAQGPSWFLKELLDT